MHNYSYQYFYSVVWIISLLKSENPSIELCALHERRLVSVGRQWETSIAQDSVQCL